jgi:hypothetical protein
MGCLVQIGRRNVRDFNGDRIKQLQLKREIIIQTNTIFDKIAVCSSLIMDHSFTNCVYTSLIFLVINQMLLSEILCRYESSQTVYMQTVALSKLKMKHS